jgi:hypothetical protein
MYVIKPSVYFPTFGLMSNEGDEGGGGEGVGVRVTVRVSIATTTMHNVSMLLKSSQVASDIWYDSQLN